MRLIIAVWLSKILIVVGKLVGKKGSSTPGIYALKICPSILKKLAKQVRKDIIVVCGTNGKTTTNNLLNTIITSAENKVVCNSVGANMLPGVVTSFIDKTNFFGKLNADYACIEIDEMSAVKVFEHFEPDYMVVTNLFRDQLDRYGEVEITLSYLEKAIGMCKNINLILNADDPVVSSLTKKTGKNSFFFGVGEDVGVSLKETKEGRFCVFCGQELEYNYFHYSQLGDFKCPNCGFKHPEMNLKATNVNLDNGIKFNVDDKVFDLKYRGFYNIYNILAAYSVVVLARINVDNIYGVLNNYKPQIGRMEEFSIKGKNVILNLAKNPAGFNQAISTVMCDTRKKNIIIAVNDMPSDGRDISWIWDVDFETLNSESVNNIYTSGIRHNDLEVRFKYADFNNVEDYKDIKNAILNGLDNCDVLYVLVNYTMLFSTQDILKSLEAEK